MTVSRPLVLFGPTAVGKTGLLFSFPDIPIEVISADSMQVYRGFDLGTAKPSASERAMVPHHLIDVLEPDTPFDVGEFVGACDRLVPEICSRGAVPVIAGGTAYYLRAYLYGLPPTPPADPHVRAVLQRRLQEEGLPALRAELARIDPDDEARIGAGDAYRVLRALEVYHTAGRPRTSYAYPARPRPGVNALVVGLTRERAELYRRINQRVNAMFDAGLPDEVAELAANGARADWPACAAIGYREFFELGVAPPWTRAQVEAVRESVARNTRRYAKRQITFMKQLPIVRWMDPSAPADRAGFGLLLRELLNTSGS